MEIIHIIAIGLLSLTYSETAPSSLSPYMQAPFLSDPSKRSIEWKSSRNDFNTGLKANLNTHIPFVNTNRDAIRLSNRFPELEDSRLNWGLIAEDTPIYDENYYSRPITIPKIEDMENFRKTKQVRIEKNKPRATEQKNKAKVFPQEQESNFCYTAIVSCCIRDDIELKNCFSTFKCNNLPEDVRGNPCSQPVVNNALNKVISFYVS